jgi:hypothetical protein
LFDLPFVERTESVEVRLMPIYIRVTLVWQTIRDVNGQYDSATFHPWRYA